MKSGKIRLKYIGLMVPLEIRMALPNSMVHAEQGIQNMATEESACLSSFAVRGPRETWGNEGQRYPAVKQT